jgi:hypothetical protein
MYKSCRILILSIILSKSISIKTIYRKRYNMYKVIFITFVIVLSIETFYVSSVDSQEVASKPQAAQGGGGAVAPGAGGNGTSENPFTVLNYKKISIKLSAFKLVNFALDGLFDFLSK